MASWFGGYFRGENYDTREAVKDPEGGYDPFKTQREGEYEDHYDRYDPLLKKERDTKITQKEYNDFIYNNSLSKDEFHENIRIFWEDERQKKMIISSLLHDDKYSLFLNRLDGENSKKLLKAIGVYRNKNGQVGGIIYLDQKIINRGRGGKGNFRYSDSSDRKIVNAAANFKDLLRKALDEHEKRIQDSVEKHVELKNPDEVEAITQSVQSGSLPKIMRDIVDRWKEKKESLV